MLLNNRYEYNPTTDLIGKGGLAEVFKAYDKEFDRYVAIKKFNTADSPMKYSLKNEFQKSLHFAHDNLVRAYDFFTVVRKYEDGETHETQYGVMELLEGGDLSDYLKKKPPLSELLEVVKGILRGLDYLHTPNPNTDKKTIIHRDIKPGNILIYYNRQGKPIPKIADFNVAKEASTTAESSHSQVGTYEYMATEQLNSGKYGVGGQVHANTDLWALGVILCDHLMGKSLFGRRSEGNTQGQIIGKILDKPIPTEDIKKLPAPFNGVIALCLVRKAKDRAQSASELLTWFNSIEETTIITPLVKQKNTNYLFIILAAIVLLFVLMLVYKLILTDTDKHFAGNENEVSDKEALVVQKDVTTKTSITTFDDSVKQAEKSYAKAKALGDKFDPMEDKIRNYFIKQEYIGCALESAIKKGIRYSLRNYYIENGFSGESLESAVKMKMDDLARSGSISIGNDPFADQMVLVEGGTFMMGSPSTESGRKDDEYQHKVMVSSFKISKYEVTQAQWCAVMDSNPSFNNECYQCPVEKVSYEDIQEFLFQLNQQTSKKYRLPTEAEWEYAAKGGNKSKGYKYAGSNNINEVGWYLENSGDRSRPVGGKAPNELGLYDMSGNVWEWCSDWFGSYNYKNSPMKNPQGPEFGSMRVFRGGCWIIIPNCCRVAFRGLAAPTDRFNRLGFRLVFDP